MSVNAITPGTVLQNNPAPSATLTVRQAEGRQLAEALKTGDLAAAAKAFSALSTSGPNGSGPYQIPRLAADFNDIGKALKSGNLASAQKALATLKQDIHTTILVSHRDPVVTPASGTDSDVAGPAPGLNVKA